MKKIGSFLYAFIPLLGLAWLLGAIVKDRGLLSSLLFYIPAPVVVVAGTGWLLATRKHMRLVLSSLVAAITVAALLQVLIVDTCWLKPPYIPKRNIKLVHWNIAYGFGGSEAILEILQHDQADIVVLSELPDEGFPDTRELWDQRVYQLEKDGMMIASRFPLKMKKGLELEGAVAWCGQAHTPYGRVDLVVTDFESSPVRSRRKRIEDLATWCKQYKLKNPIILLGDFNTPRTSSQFNVLRKVMANACERDGHGWPYSWPVPFPVYAIDQIWVSGRISVFNYQLKTSIRSDHRRQIMHFMVRPLRR